MENKAFVQGMVRQFDRKAAEESRTVEFVISDETRDRHGTVIPIGAWQLENFNKNGIAGYQHDVYGEYDPDPDKIIGVAKAWVEGEQLIGSITFEPADVNPFAEKLFRKVLNGTLKAVSVGFRVLAPGKWGEGEQAVSGKNPTYYFGSVELLEVSIVNIPSNPNALRRKLEETEVEGLRKQLQESYDENFRLLAQLTAQGQEIDTLNKTVEYYRNKSRRG